MDGVYAACLVILMAYSTFTAVFLFGQQHVFMVYTNQHNDKLIAMPKNASACRSQRTEIKSLSF